MPLAYFAVEADSIRVDPIEQEWPGLPALVQRIHMLNADGRTEAVVSIKYQPGSATWEAWHAQRRLDEQRAADAAKPVPRKADAEA